MPKTRTVAPVDKNTNRNAFEDLRFQVVDNALPFEPPMTFEIEAGHEGPRVFLRGTNGHLFGLIEIRRAKGKVITEVTVCQFPGNKNTHETSVRVDMQTAQTTVEQVPLI